MTKSNLSQDKQSLIKEIKKSISSYNERLASSQRLIKKALRFQSEILYSIVSNSTSKK